MLHPYGSIDESFDAVHARRSLLVGQYGAACAALGVVASGPLAMAIVAEVQPQPRWVSAAQFAEHFHLIQVLPFALGFFLVGGFLSLLVSLQQLSGHLQRARSSVALAFALVFAALVFFNYILQVSFVPALARSYSDEHGTLIAAFSMARPGSLGWSLELWGYAFLGLASWLVAPFFAGEGLEGVARWSFVANGPASILGAVWGVFSPGWELGTVGMLAFAGWNVLAFVMAFAAFAVLRARRRGHRTYKAAHVTAALESPSERGVAPAR